MGEVGKAARKKMLLINAVCGTGSTGRICTDIATKYEALGYDVRIAYGRQNYVPEEYKKYAVQIGTQFDVKIHAINTRFTDRHGFGSYKATKKFLQWASSYDPDILWLHNLHGYYINIELLFTWIKSRPGMQVKWTLHDCWAFTGHCTYFTAIECQQWKTHCMDCVQKRCYPASYGLDNCKRNFERKKAAFTGVKNMTLITPSNWHANLIRQSFLREYSIEVVYNTIDQKVFKPTLGSFREQHRILDKKIVLGVANPWSERKGLVDFFKLREILDNRFAIVLVGLSNKQLKKLPKGIIGIKRINNLKELAQIYTIADVLVNPSREETFGMTILEAFSCGTKSIVYKDTACEEIVKKFSCGVSVAPQNILELRNAVLQITKTDR